MENTNEVSSNNCSVDEVVEDPAEKIKESTSTEENEDLTATKISDVLPSKAVKPNTNSKRKKMSLTSRPGKSGKPRAAQGISDILKSKIEDMTPFLGDKVNKQKTIHKNMTLMDISKTTAGMITSHYKLNDDDVINTTLLALVEPENYKRKPTFDPENYK